MRKEVMKLKSMDLTVEECVELITTADRQYKRLTGKSTYEYAREENIPFVIACDPKDVDTVKGLFKDDRVIMIDSCASDRKYLNALEKVIKARKVLNEAVTTLNDVEHIYGLNLLNLSWAKENIMESIRELDK